MINSWNFSIFKLFWLLRVVLSFLSDGDTDFFDNVAGIMQRDTLAPYLFIICIDYVLQTLIDLMKENGFTLEKARSWWYPA